LLTLAIDTSEARGSVAVLRGADLLSRNAHNDRSDYSAWLLPAVAEAMADAGAQMQQVELLAVSTGPGSFTGLRVGLTAVKAWGEVYKAPIVGVPRLEAMARFTPNREGLVATCYDAQRGQLFGGLFRESGSGLVSMMEQVVMAPEEFVELVDTQACSAPVLWIALDPQMMERIEVLKTRVAGGDRVVACSPELAPLIGLLAEERAANGQFSDPLTLDANYVRRSDAEIFWNGSSTRVR
jgi:tRNA threonylcarbamoyladenosine biosynthesis protein TsaB